MRISKSWSEEESSAVVSIIENLKNENPDVKKGEILNIGMELFNERFENKRTLVAFKNHYYSLIKIDKKDTSNNIPIKDEREEATDIVRFVDGIVSSYQALVQENKAMREEISRINADYKAMLNVLERARKLVVNEEFPIQPKRFTMETNGNLVSSLG